METQEPVSKRHCSHPPTKSTSSSSVDKKVGNISSGSNSVPQPSQMGDEFCKQLSQLFDDIPADTLEQLRRDSDGDADTAAIMHISKSTSTSSEAEPISNISSASNSVTQPSHTGDDFCKQLGQLFDLPADTLEQLRRDSDGDANKAAIMYL